MTRIVSEVEFFLHIRLLPSKSFFFLKIIFLQIKKNGKEAKRKKRRKFKTKTNTIKKRKWKRMRMILTSTNT